MDIDKIKRQAKQILDNFADALASVEKEAKKEEGVNREEFERKEDAASSEQEYSEASKNADFRGNFLKNAPGHDDDFIITERGEWK